MTAATPPNSLIIKCDISVDGKTWHPSLEIHNTRTK
jgi:hypothetical protein